MVDTSARESAVTRVEVIEAIGSVFMVTPLSKPDIIAAALASGPRRRVLDLLQRLPERRYRRPADLWYELPDVPVET